MYAIIAGSREVNDYRRLVDTIVHSGFHDDITHVVSGNALGVDLLGVRWARNVGLSEHNIHVFLPRYDQSDNQRFAPLDRNEEMARFVRERDPIGGVLIALWHPDEINVKRGGTAHMILTALKYGIETYVEVI